jgi:hypothetical protein
VRSPTISDQYHLIIIALRHAGGCVTARVKDPQRGRRSRRSGRTYGAGRTCGPSFAVGATWTGCSGIPFWPGRRISAAREAERQRDRYYQPAMCQRMLHSFAPGKPAPNTMQSLDRRPAPTSDERAAWRANRRRASISWICYCAGPAHAQTNNPGCSGAAHFAVLKDGRAGPFFANCGHQRFVRFASRIVTRNIKSTKV